MNRAMLRRAWAMGAGPSGDVLTIDADATLVPTYGPDKEGSTFAYRREGVALSPMVGICGETGDVLALRARGGNANAGLRWVASWTSAWPPSLLLSASASGCGSAWTRRATTASASGVGDHQNPRLAITRIRADLRA